MHQVDFSIIVCTYNRAMMLNNALKCLIHQNIGNELLYEIIVIDDGSTDETRHIVEKIASFCRVPIKYLQEKGKGYTHAMNRGVTESQGKWLVFFDDDELADTNWLKELYTVAVNEHVQVVGGSVVLLMSESGIQLSKLGPFCRALYGEHPTPGGGNLLVARTVFDSIGVFDEMFLTGGCDSDLLIRAQDAGFNIGWAPKAVIRHVISPDRLTPGCIKHYSQQAGCSFAYRDWKRLVRWKVTLVCIARIGQALLVNLPLLFLCYVEQNRTKVLDRKALIWRAEGYVRKTLFLLAPWLFPQKSFFSHMEFRRQRAILQKDTNLNRKVTL